MWWTTYKIHYETLVKPKKLEEHWFTKDETKKLFEAMLGEKPLPIPVVGAPVPAIAPIAPITRDVLPEKWEQLWLHMPRNVVGKPDLVTSEDGLEACILYGIELGIIWSRIKTGQDKWDLEKKTHVAIEPETSLEAQMLSGNYHDIILIN